MRGTGRSILGRRVEQFQAGAGRVVMHHILAMVPELGQGFLLLKGAQE